MKKKIIFISTAITAPYVLKKIKAFRSNGYDTKLYAYNRGDNFERLDNQDLGEVINLGYLESGRGYLKKLLYHISTLKRIYSENRDCDSIYLLFTFDLAIINLLFYKKKIVYHISDMTYAKTKVPFIASFFRKIDRTIVRKSYLTIVTSRGFCRYIYPEGDIYNKFIEVPNLLQEDNPYNREETMPINNSDSLRFGFVGLSRYESPIRFAKVIGERYPKHSFAFYGNGVPELIDKIEALTSSYSNISSHGRFNSSTDLADIYSNIDILICCYDVLNMNVRLAEPNKLYEAIFFNKPIVVSSNTYLAEKVNSLGVGYSVNCEDEKDIISFIDSLSVSGINEIINRIQGIPTSMLVDNGDRVVKDIEERVK